MAGDSNSGTGSSEADLLTHPDIAICIVKQITNLGDYIRFGGVCKSWRSAALRDRFATARHQPPGFISKSRSLWQTYRFIPISHGGDRPVVRDLHGGTYPHRRIRWIRSHSSVHALNPSHGWLISRNYRELLVLLNPAIGAKIPLPSIARNDAFTISKAAISSIPSSPDAAKACYVLVLHDGPMMAICKVGDADWRYVESGSEVLYRDAIYFEGKFYVLMSNGDFSAIDEDQFGADSPSTSHVAHLDLQLDPEGEDGEFRSWLAEIGRELMVLVYYPKRKKMFEIYKLDLISKDWVSVEESFGDYALFVGDGQAIALAMDTVPAVSGFYECIMANHIYFAATVVEKSFVYGFEDYAIRGLCCPQHLTNTLEQTGLWFSPVPW